MFDANGKIFKAGELRGQTYHLGSYYSCLEVKANFGHALDHPFQGQHCTTKSHGVPVKNGYQSRTSSPKAIFANAPFIPPMIDPNVRKLFKF